MAATRHIRFLASVRNVDEARLAMAEGADFIDCKEPAAGALGALPHAVVGEIRRALPQDVAVSATIGDLPCEPAILSAAASAMAATGVDYVKAGIFGGERAHESIGALGRVELGSSRLVAVLFADQRPDFTLISAAAEARFAGVMIDTAGKDAGPLINNLSLEQLEQFIAAVRAHGMFAGLAGSLRLEHITPLRALAPDILGFRGALCAGGQRKGALDALSIRAVRRALKGPLGSQLHNGPEALAS